jgi:hypothetical protein
MATAATSRWERETWPIFRKLVDEVPEAGIHLQSKSERSPTHFALCGMWSPAFG